MLLPHQSRGGRGAPKLLRRTAKRVCENQVKYESSEIRANYLETVQYKSYSGTGTETITDLYRGVFYEHIGTGLGSCVHP